MNASAAAATHATQGADQIDRDRYDIVVVGAGHNGLVAANYFRRSGLSVIVLEKASGVGGNAVTVEPLLAGFHHNPHANYLAFCDLMPMMQDFSLREGGLELTFPEAQFGVAFSDGRPPVILHRQDLLDRTFASFRAYSKKDARTYLELKRRSATLASIIRRGLYTSPNREWFAEQRHAVQLTFGDMCSRNSIGSRTARQLIDELFRAAEVRMLLYLLAMDCGIAIEEVGGDLGFLGLALWIGGRWRLPVGGMQSVSNAIYRSAAEADVVVRCGRRVHRVLLDNNKAIGVLNDDGSLIYADKAVVGAIPIPTLMFELLDSQSLSAQEQSELHRFEGEQNVGSIATSMFCLNQRPHYKSSRYDAAIDQCFKTTIGYDSPEDVLKSAADNSVGLLPSPAGTIRLNTLWDLSQPEWTAYSRLSAAWIRKRGAESRRALRARSLMSGAAIPTIWISHQIWVCVVMRWLGLNAECYCDWAALPIARASKSFICAGLALILEAVFTVRTAITPSMW